MKKTKLLSLPLGLLSLSIIPSMATTLASCGCKSSSDLEVVSVSAVAVNPAKQVGTTLEESDICVTATLADGSTKDIKYGEGGYTINNVKFGHKFTTDEIGTTVQINVIYKSFVSSCFIKVTKEDPTIQYHTVSFDTGVEGLTVDSQVIENNKCALEPAVRREGYQVDYWTYNDLPFSFKTPVTANMTLKAVWSEVTAGGGNLDTIQYPTIAAADYKEYESTNDIVKAYLAAITANTEIFKQDILYSWSCSNITTKLQLCKLIAFDKYTSNVTISNIAVDTSKMTIEFDAEVKTNVKINNSVEKSWIEWIGWNFRSLDSTTKMHYKFDLTDTCREEQEEYAGEREFTNTSIESGHVRYINGVCGIRYNANSTLKVTSESGTLVDLDGNSKEYTKSESNNVDFVLKDEMSTALSEYPLAIFSTNSLINFDADTTGAYAFSEGGNMVSNEEEILTNGVNCGFKFASAYMAASNLDKNHLIEFLSFIEDDWSENYIRRINRVYDDLHFELVQKDLDNTFTLPDGLVGTDGHSYIISPNAFNPTYNRPFPNNCTIKLSENTKGIINSAFYNNNIYQLYLPESASVSTRAFAKDDEGDTIGCITGILLINSQKHIDSVTDNDDLGYAYDSVENVYVKDGLTATAGKYLTNNFTDSGETKEVSGVTYHIWKRSW